MAADRVIAVQATELGGDVLSGMALGRHPQGVTNGHAQEHPKHFVTIHW
jgi:hypothetical protein